MNDLRKRLLPNRLIFTISKGKSAIFDGKLAKSYCPAKKGTVRFSSPIPILLGIFLLLIMFALAAFPQSSRNGAPTPHDQPDAGLAQIQNLNEIRALAAAAKLVFRERMEPSITKLTLIDIGWRDKSTVLRNYVRRSFDDAIDALMAEATTPDRALAIQNALREFVETGHTSAAEAIFTEMLKRKTAEGKTATREAAAVARHSVALVELPSALAKIIKPPFEPFPFPPLGEKALPAYKHAAELDPDDAWTWIILTVIGGQDVPFDFAIMNAERAASAAGDWHAVVTSKQLFGLNRELQGQVAEADHALSEALALARQRSVANPSDADWQREVARSKVWIGAMKAKRGGPEARTAYEEALSIRKELAANHPDSMQNKVDLIASYEHLFELLVTQGRKDEANTYIKEASPIYDALASQSRFEPTIDALNEGGIAIVMAMAGGLTLIFGLVILIAYRRRIARWMTEAAKIATIPFNERPTSPFCPGSEFEDIPIRLLDTSDRLRRTLYCSESISHADKRMQKAAWVYAAAGFAFSATAAILWFRLTNTEILFNRAAVILLVWAWPVLLTLNLLWGQDRRRLGLLVFVYFGILLGLCWRVAMSDTSPIQVFGLILLC